MSGLTPELPLSIDFNGGFQLLTTYKRLVAQNLRMLLLTIPGERVMLPEFGVGLHQMLFEADVSTSRDKIAGRIRGQVGAYLPYVEIRDIKIASHDTNSRMASGRVHVSVSYRIIPLGIFDLINVEVSSIE